MTQALYISDLSPDDSDAINQIALILLEAFPHWKDTQDETRAEVHESFAEGHLSLVAREGDSVLGWVGAIPTYDYAWELHPLVVAAEARGKGVGSALVGALEARVRERGALTLYLGTDDDGEIAGTNAGDIDLFPNPLQHAANLEVFDHPVAFYRRLGFVVVGLIPDANGPGKPDVLMAKRVASEPLAFRRGPRSP
jgi:aminoglycoside 6'-N-acetyltransferase I